MRLYIISGERSGDLHASNLVKAHQALSPETEWRGTGGEYSQEAGVSLFRHYKEISFMGFFEVFMNLRKISQIFKAVQQDILDYKPDAVVLVDFGGFNMRLAKFLHAKGIKVIYYISPKIWAWNQKRAYKIKASVDKMLVIMPFEKAFYKTFGMEVTYVGNPVNDAIHQHGVDSDFRRKNKLSDKPLLAILAGSRKQEVTVMLQTMLDVVKQFPQCEPVVAAVGNLPAEFYAPCLAAGVKVLTDDTYNLLAHAHVAVVTSGTATLETALFKVPQVVCYKTNWITYHIAKRLVKISHFSLPNLIAGKEVVPELLQDQYTPEVVSAKLSVLIEGAEREKMLDGYAEIQSILGKPGASQAAAQEIVHFLTVSKS